MLRGSWGAAGFDFGRVAGVTAAGMRGRMIGASAQRIARHERAEHEQNER